MSHRSLLILLGVALIAVGFLERGWAWIVVWVGCDFLILGIAHARGAHGVTGKRSDGFLPVWSWLLFLPLLLSSLAVWNLIRLLSRAPAQNVVSVDLVIGRRLLAHEVDGEFANYVDLTAEFPEPAAIRRKAGYRCVPILDGSAPDPSALARAVSQLRAGRTFIHCAQGYGRTGLFALAVLLRSGGANSVDEGLKRLQAARPGIRLSTAQRRCIDSFALNRKA